MSSGEGSLTEEFLDVSLGTILGSTGAGTETGGGDPLGVDWSSGGVGVGGEGALGAPLPPLQQPQPQPAMAFTYLSRD